MRKTLLLTLPLFLLSAPLRAQVDSLNLTVPSKPDDLLSLQRMLNPAMIALDHRAELELTEAQVAELEAVLPGFIAEVGKLWDVLNQHRASWLGDPDDPAAERELRAYYHRKADAEADWVLATRRLQVRIDGMLEPSQRKRLDALKLREMQQQMMRIFEEGRGPGR